MNRAQRRAEAKKRAKRPLRASASGDARQAAAADSAALLRLNYDPAQTPHQIHRAHLDWAARHAAALYPAHATHRNDPAPARRLRVGYVSADLRRHPVALFVEPILRSHDPAAIDSVCYDVSDQDDDMKRHLRRLARHWRQVSALSDDELAEMIRSDGIDILIDLSGHTPGNRLLTFARKPAPIQVTAIGYVATTGLATMDYRLTDALCDPDGSEAFYSETLWRLPGGFNGYAPPQGLPDPGPPPHLTSGAITFGSFNNLDKVSPALLDTWAQILRRVKDSHLLLKTKTLSDPQVQRNILARLGAQGIAPERVELLEWSPTLRAHFGCYRRLDIALDTFPYNGTTTTCEALMMGVPVVTLAGERHASRVSASILSRLGLEALIASSVESYVELATALAHQPKVIGGLRTSLRRRLAASPLGDAKSYSRDLEAAYRQMWQRWCAKQGAGRAA